MFGFHELYSIERATLLTYISGRSKPKFGEWELLFESLVPSLKRILGIAMHTLDSSSRAMRGEKLVVRIPKRDTRDKISPHAVRDKSKGLRGLLIVRG